MTDFFDDVNAKELNTPLYPQQLFSCSEAQANYVTKSRVSRDNIYDGVVRSQVTCMYKTHIVENKQVTGKTARKVRPPWPRQQLKHNEVMGLVNFRTVTSTVYVNCLCICS